MLHPVVHHAALRVRGSPVVGMAVAVVVSANLARCIPLLVRVAVTRRRCRSNHAVTNLFIVVIAFSRRSLAEVMTEERGGNNI
jgi:hypothetical protein